MPTSNRMVAIAIGVSDAKPLQYLPAAVNSARQFFDWAATFGYEAKLLTDETQPLTMDRLCMELESAITARPEPIQRLVLYFAGHGLIREAEEGLWLLSDWHNDLRAVAVEPLKRRLARFNINQIAIFADSCRSLPQDIEAADLTPDAVLGRGPAQRGDPSVDKFIASQDGAETFSVPGDNPEDDRCIFSGVLLEGLWGLNKAAFSASVPNRITSQSLARYLKTEVPAVADRYGRTLKPSAIPTFPEGEDIYYEQRTPPPPPPKFPAWPDVTKVLAQGVTTTPQKTLGVDSGGTAAPTMAERLRTQDRPQGFETGSGFAIDGAPIRRLWTSPDVMAEWHHQQNWWRVWEMTDSRLKAPAAILIEFEDDLFAAVTALPEFIATVMRDARGVAALIYRPAYTDYMARPHRVQAGEPLADSESAIEHLEQGTMRAEHVTDLAVTLRTEKHVDPVLGVISAYLYDSIGDIDSIRKMAYYYTIHDQPIPYDIALLGQLQGRFNGRYLETDVPAVAAREPRTGAERKFQWAYGETQAATGVVGGLWPWMRQGWTFLNDPGDFGSTLVLPGLVDLTEDLTSGRFATFKANAAQRLIQNFGMVPHA